MRKHCFEKFSIFKHVLIASGVAFVVAAGWLWMRMMKHSHSVSEQESNLEVL
jgi:flagellar biogenesis protein FliO